MFPLQKKRYIFNPSTGQYEPRRVSVRTRALRFLCLFVLSLGLSGAYISLGVAWFDLKMPRTYFLEGRHARLRAALEDLQRDFDEAALRLDRVEERDNLVYRNMFGMEQIPADIRDAGFGGAERYAYLDYLSDGGALKGLARRMDVLTKKAYVQSLSFDDIEKAASQADEMALCVPSISPVERGSGQYMSSPFGYRADPFSGAGSFHKGIDFPSPAGTPIYVTGNGTVESVSYNYSGYGRFVIVDHGFGYKTRYAHLREAKCYEGQKVSRGDLIGLMGNTGVRSTGSHLHYEVLYMGRPVNPYFYFNNDLDSTEYKALVNVPPAPGVER